MKKEKYLNTVRIRFGDEDSRKLQKTIRVLNEEGWKLIKIDKPGGTYFADMERVIYDIPWAIND
jgi:hypothetical protein